MTSLVESVPTDAGRDARSYFADRTLLSGVVSRDVAHAESELMILLVSFSKYPTWEVG